MPPLTQRSFLRGLDASTSKFNQPQGSLPGISNLVFTRRGSLITCDGTVPLSTPTNKFNPTANKGSIVSIQQYLTGSFTGPGSATPSGSPLPVGTGADGGGGGDNWFNPNAIASGGFAECDMNSGDTSDWLQATNFNFNIPSGATLNTVKATFLAYRNRWATGSGTSAGSISCGQIFLIKGGTRQGANKGGVGVVNFPFGTAANAATSNVGGTDLWGLALAPTDVNQSNFGVAINVNGTGNIDTASPSAFIGKVTITITYTAGGGGIQAQTGQVLFYLEDPDVGTQLGEVTGLTLTSVNVAGGTLTPGNTYQYGVTVLDGQQNSSAGATASIVLGGGSNAVQVTWNSVLGAASYLVWGGQAGAPTNASPKIAQVFQAAVQQNTSGFVGGPTATFTDKGLGAAALTNTPYGTIVFGSNNTIGSLRLFTAAAINPAQLSYADPVLLAQFPCRSSDALLPNNPPIDANGGLIGSSGQVPMMIQFANLIVIALGNGIQPYYSDGTNVFPFTNTFTAQYAPWAASTTYLVGDLIQATVSSVAYVFKCTQQGQTQTPGPPTFPAALGATLVDGQATWVNVGQVTTSPALRGAAHAIYHAGSMWALNTQPINTSDNLDGPSVLAMSDSNNIKSWNPLNRAFIGKDDGSSGTGLASFTIAEFGIAPLGSLFVFKNFSTYQVVGVFGSSNFSIQALPTDMGCVAPRSIQYLSGYGIGRLAHLGFAIHDGVRDRLISEPIRPYIFGTPATTAGSSPPPITGIDLNHAYLVKGEELINPPMYIAAAPVQGQLGLNRLFIYDLVLKSWSIFDLPAKDGAGSTNPSSFISSLYQVRTPGFQPFTVVGGYNSGSIQTIQNGIQAVAQWQNMVSVLPVAWAFTTPEVFNTNDPSSEVYIGSLIIRGINANGNAVNVTVNLNTEGGYTSAPQTFAIGNGEFELFVGIMETAISANAIISGTGYVEIESLTWDVSQKPGGRPLILT